MSIFDDVLAALIAHKEEDYKRFQSGLIPTLDPSTMLGVRAPILRRLAKQFSRRGDMDEFLGNLPHRYYEENVLHTFMVAEMIDYARCMEETERFLPYMDNWAVCDGFAPKVFAANREALLERCRLWLRSDHSYTVRYGLVMLLKHFLSSEYAAEALALAAAVNSDEYYVNVAVAWLFAEAMGKCPSLAQPYFQDGRLKDDVHNKAIQKAVESRKVSDETKAYLKTLKRKKS